MSARTRFIARVTLAYAVLATVWIFFSDQMLTHVGDVSTAIELATLKGLAFIGLTSAMLVIALLRAPPPALAETRDFDGLSAAAATGRRPRAPIAVLLILTAAIVGIGIVTYRTQVAMTREAAVQQLETIVKANVHDVERWLDERRGNARQLSGNIAVARLVARWRETGTERDRDSIIGLMNSVRDSYRLGEVELWDPEGNRLLQTGGGIPGTESVRASVIDAVAKGTVTFATGRFGEDDYAIRMFAPLPIRSGVSVGVLVFDLRPEHQVAAVMNPWPIRSASGETIMSRRDGDWITTVSELRHRGAQILNRSPVHDDPRLVGIQAYSGKTRILDGIDYRGVPVLAAAQPVPGTPWLLLAKIDQAEVLASLHDLGRNTILLTLAALATTMAIIGLMWQRQQLRTALTEVTQARAIEAAEMRFKATFEQAAVGIAHVGFDNRFQRVNQRLCEILGYGRDELLTKRLVDVRHPLDEGGEDDVTRRIVAGEIDNFNSEKRHVRKDGSVVWLAITTSLAAEPDGTPSYLIMVLEDISARIADKEALRKSEERFQLAMRGTNDGIWDTDLVTGTIHWSPRCAAMLGYPDAELVLDEPSWMQHVHPDDQPAVAEHRREFIAGRQDRYEIEYRLRHQDGRWIDVLSRGFLMRDADGTPVRAVGTHVDISGRKAIEQALRERVNLHEYLARIADSLPGAIVSLRKQSDGTLSMPFASSRLYEISGHHPADVREDAEPLFARVHPEDIDRIRHGFAASAQAMTPWHDECRIVHPDKGVIWVEGHTTPEREADGSILWHGFVHDITERRRHEEKLRQAMTVFESTHEGVVITDTQGNILTVNPAFTGITGYAEGDILGRNMRLLQSGVHDRGFYQKFWHSVTTAGFWQGEIWNRRKDGEVFPAWLGISIVKGANGAAVGYVGTFTDLTRIKQSETQLEHLAHYDPLTDLPNRLLLRSRIDHAVARARRNGSRGAFLFFDLDRFKTVNESFGHRIGDEVLRSAAKRLLERLRDIDTVARLGGDQFGILLEDLAGAEEAARVAESLIAYLREPFEIANGCEAYIGASIGITLFPADGEDADHLLQNAELALQEAKAAARGTAVFYTSLLTSAARTRLELDASLRRALDCGEFTLHYQPLVGIDGERIKGVEALLRWAGPGGGDGVTMVPPSLFIPIAEETGLIVPLGEWVLRTACTQMKAWRDAGIQLDTVAVNLSPVQFLRPDLPERVADILAETGLSARALELEITEGVLVDATEESLARLARLKALGVRLAIDDFGTGYSSLGYLKRMPIDKVKIDKSFTAGLPDDAADAKIVMAVISLAHSLRLEVLAEGVETAAQLTFLRRHGCDSAQGFLFSKPVPGSEIAAVVAAAKPTDLAARPSR